MVVFSSSILWFSKTSFASDPTCQWHKKATPRGASYECVIVNEKAGWFKRVRKDSISSSTVLYRTVPRGSALKKGSILEDDTGYPGTSKIDYISTEKIVLRIKGLTPPVTLYR